MGNTSATPEIAAPASSPAMLPPSGCPMNEANVHSKMIPPSGCPMHISNNDADKINPTNMVPKFLLLLL